MLGKLVISPRTRLFLKHSLVHYKKKYNSVAECQQVKSFRSPMKERHHTFQRGM